MILWFVFHKETEEEHVHKYRCELWSFWENWLMSSWLLYVLISDFEHNYLWNRLPGKHARLLLLLLQRLLQLLTILPAVCTELPAAPPAGLHGLCGTKRALSSSPVNLLSLESLVWNVVLGLAAVGSVYHPGWLAIEGKKTSPMVDTHDIADSPTL